MTIRGLAAVTRVECAKLAAQPKVPAILVACLVGPVTFVVGLRAQSAVPADTLFGRAVKESGFATPLVVLGFAALWVFPALTSVVGGDMFSAEDRYGTWATMLTRSCGRAEVFFGKVLAAAVFSMVAVAALGSSSVAAGVLLIGRQPLVDLSGMLVPPGQALGRTVLAWATVIPPILAFTSLAVLVSVITRSSAAGVGLPVVAGLTMQLYASFDGPEASRWILITSAFGSWHGLMTEPPFYRPLVYGTAVSAVCVVVCLTIAFAALRRRDIGA